MSYLGGSTPEEAINLIFTECFDNDLCRDIAQTGYHGTIKMNDTGWHSIFHGKAIP